MKDYRVDRRHWAQLTIFEQMGKIYPEVVRSFKAYRDGDFKVWQEAMNRALDLFDATIEVLFEQKTYKHRVKEVLIARSEFLRTLYDDHTPEEEASLERYFYQFAQTARLHL
jgi:hypothetical protein